MNEAIENIKKEMLTQDNRSTAYPIFIIVEDKKIWGYSYSSDFDGKERPEDIDISQLCEGCDEEYHESGELPDDCDNCDLDAFHYYKIEEDVPNLYAGFFFTDQAAQNHLDANPHHYNKTAKTYGISAYHNYELREVMKYLCGKDLR